jgi:hypothetical protein
MGAGSAKKRNVFSFCPETLLPRPNRQERPVSRGFPIGFKGLLNSLPNRFRTSLPPECSRAWHREYAARQSLTPAFNPERTDESTGCCHSDLGKLTVADPAALLSSAGRVEHLSPPVHSPVQSPRLPPVLASYLLPALAQGDSWRRTSFPASAGNRSPSHVFGSFSRRVQTNKSAMAPCSPTAGHNNGPPRCATAPV